MFEQFIATPATPTPSGWFRDERELRQVAEDREQAIAVGDLEAILRLYTEDAWLHPPGLPIAKTDAARRAVWADRLALGRVLEPRGEIRVDIARAGEWAMSYGMFAEGQCDPLGLRRGLSEKYVTAWKRLAHGEWKITADIWNRSP